MRQRTLRRRIRARRSQATAALAIVAATILCRVNSLDAQEQLYEKASVSPIDVGPGSGQILLADLNGDEHMDLITQHLLQRKIVVMSGDGKGGFASPAQGTIDLEYQPGNMGLGDLNQDGILDLVVASRDEEREYLHLMMGKGDGGFESGPKPALVVAAATKTYKPSVNLLDIDEDGRLDVVFVNRRRATIEVLLGDGRGGFTAGPTSHRDTGDNFTFGLGDIDGDGHVDLVSVVSGTNGEPGRLTTLRGDGRGAFAKAKVAGPSLPPHSRIATLADTNRDDRLDIVLVHDADRLTVLENDRGHFKPNANGGSPVRVGMPAYGVVAADVNRDGRSDLVAATVERQTPWTAKLEVLLGSGPRFKTAPGSPYSAEPGAYNLAVGDVNEDDKPDIVASSFEGAGITVLLGR